jgi:hypothetical protein
LQVSTPSNCITNQIPPDYYGFAGTGTIEVYSRVEAQISEFPADDQAISGGIEL